MIGNIVWFAATVESTTVKTTTTTTTTSSNTTNVSTQSADPYPCDTSSLSGNL